MRAKGTLPPHEIPATAKLHPCVSGTAKAPPGAWRCARATVVFSRLRETIGRVVGQSLWNHRLHHSVALEVVERALRRVERDLMEVRRPETRLLRIKINKRTDGLAVVDRC